MDYATPELIHRNAEKSLTLASALFPYEEWVLKEPHIWVAKSRLPEEYREPDKWAKEMAQVRILAGGGGSIAYFLPEKKAGGDAGLRAALAPPPRLRYTGNRYE